MSSPASSPSWGLGQSSLVCWRGINPISRGGTAILPSTSSSLCLFVGRCSVPPSTPPAAGLFPDLHTSWGICCDFLRAGSLGLPHCDGLLPQKLRWARAPMVARDGVRCPDPHRAQGQPGTPGWCWAPLPALCSCSTSWATSLAAGHWLPSRPQTPAGMSLAAVTFGKSKQLSAGK